MPRQVFPDFLRHLRNDIVSSHTSGDRYLSIREIAAKFGVSVQTAQKGVTQLAAEQILEPRKKAGIYVGKGMEEIVNPLADKEVVVISKVSTPIFYQGFLDGVKERLKDTGVTVKMMVLDESEDVSSLAFGKRLVDLHADGIVTLCFTRESALPFYYAIREGVNMVADIILDDLPLLPAVQTDNYKHAFAAGRMMSQMGLDTLYVFGTYPDTNKRLLGFSQAVKNSEALIKYQQLTGVDLMMKTMSILSSLTPKTGIFLSDYTTLHNVASLCSRFHIQFTPGTVVAYDGADANEVRYPGIPAIPCIGPTFKDLGYHLCDVLVHKWTEGTYPEPLQKKI
ncbi:MAG: GntR family transcriptional regulator [Spirochaetota bacterium]|nr:GntR family transcriptional regulator [Spirochaetota bacterium]